MLLHTVKIPADIIQNEETLKAFLLRSTTGHSYSPLMFSTAGCLGRRKGEREGEREGEGRKKRKGRKKRSSKLRRRKSNGLCR